MNENRTVQTREKKQIVSKKKNQKIMYKKKMVIMQKKKKKKKNQTRKNGGKRKILRKTRIGGRRIRRIGRDSEGKDSVDERRPDKNNMKKKNRKSVK